MSIVGLTIQDLRNIESADLNFSPSLNLIFGQNGSGKTSLLEAVHFLSTGQSFRTHNIETLIRKGCDYFTVAANIHDLTSTTRLGLRRSRNKIIRRINQENINRQVLITEKLPVRILHPDSHKLISGPPGIRRSFLDWGCFYYDTQFYKTWSSVKSLIKQRNALLKSKFNSKVLASIDQQFVTLSQQLDQIRHAYIQDLKPHLQYYAEALLGSHHQVKLNYFSGWKNNLIDQLDIEIEKDRRFKRTHSGPHRADLQIIFNDETAKNSASRGQQKLLVVIFTLSQIALHQQQSQSPGLLMIDDLPSELDAQHQNLVINALFDLKQQILITAIDPDSLDLSLWTDSRMFHVKHGRFSEVV